MPKRIDNFAREVYKLDELGEPGAAQFKVFYHVQKLIDKQDFLGLHRVLECVDVKKLSPSSMKAFLSITYVYQKKCPERAVLFEKIKKQLTANLMDGNTAFPWLEKLKPYEMEIVKRR